MVKVIYCSTFARVTEGDTVGREVVLRAIKDAEDEAGRIRAEAEIKANEMISSARVKAAEALNSGRQSAEEEAASIINEARATSEKESAAVAAEGGDQLEQVVADGKKNREAASATVLSAFRGD